MNRETPEQLRAAWHRAQSEHLRRTLRETLLTAPPKRVYDYGTPSAAERARRAWRMP